MSYMCACGRSSSCLCELRPVTAVVLNEHTRSGGETSASVMRNRCAFTSRDMGADWPEAFTYAVVFGWDDPDVHEDGVMDEMAARWGWDDAMVEFLRDAHRRFQALPDRRDDGLGS